MVAGLFGLFPKAGNRIASGSCTRTVWNQRCTARNCSADEFLNGFGARVTTTISSPLRCWKKTNLIKKRQLLLSILDYTLPIKMFGPFWSVWSKMALAEVGVSLLWWCHTLVLLAPRYWRLFKSHNFFIMEKMTSFRNFLG